MLTVSKQWLHFYSFKILYHSIMYILFLLLILLRSLVQPQMINFSNKKQNFFSLFSYFTHKSFKISSHDADIVRFCFAAVSKCVVLYCNWKYSDIALHCQLCLVRRFPIYCNSYVLSISLSNYLVIKISFMYTAMTHVLHVN